MFKEILQEVVDNTDGGVAGLIMGFDGIAVDQYVSTEQSPVDVATVGMEFSVILKGIRDAAQLLDSGSAEEVSIKSERLTTLIRLINDEYFVAVTIKPSGNLGKARFLLRTRTPRLLNSLS